MRAAGCGSTASRPSPASPTTSIASSVVRTPRRPARMRSSSSTIRTRMGDSVIRLDRPMGSRTCARKREPSAFVSTLPPRSAARSRMPAIPWPPVAYGAAGAHVQRVLNREQELVGLNRDLNRARYRLHAARHWSVPPGGCGTRHGRSPEAAGARSPRTVAATSMPVARWRSRRPSTAAIPGGGSTPFAPWTVASSRSARTIWSISPTVSRATSSIVSKASRHRWRVLRTQAAEAGMNEDHVDRVAG